jgi:2-dehydro-3-deoxyphosphogluconate aldolase/(4S)-4-hydroxy-2-oxoglutarate aldolase
MRDKNDVLKTVLDDRIIAVLRAPDSVIARKLADSAIRGGINIIEITMTVPDALDVIRGMISDYPHDNVIVGAGTVLDPETARLAMLAGAEFIVSPHFNPDIVRMCHRYRIMCIAGAMSVQEAANVMESGADLIKIFPAGLFGPDIIKEIKGPFPQAMMIPSTGVTLDNLEEWFEAGAVAVFVSSEITSEALEESDLRILERKAREYVKLIREIKERL